MKIAEFLKPESIISELTATTKSGVLTELSASLSKTLTSVTQQRLSQVLEEREKVASTGIGEGVAIPHGKLPGITTLSASFGVSRNGIEFDAIDRKPTHLFFALVAPENSAGLHLKALARISRLFKNPSFRASILAAQSASEIYSLIAQEDAKA
ncbi:MAG: PTS sugar transporter subunit IIA [Myxococcaceae bacterium]